MKNKFELFLLLILLIFHRANSQPLNKAKLDSLFTALADNNKAMGSVALSKNGEIIYAKAIGYSYIYEGEKIPATLQTKYRIGSITKMFTAVMALQLVEEGKLDLNSTLDKYFANVPNAKTITISNLLNQRSGIFNFTADPDYEKWCLKPKTRAELLAMIAKGKPDFAPGEEYEYSNTNYLLLGYIIEDISGKSYGDELIRRIASKIGLKNTYAGGKTSIKNNESYSYNYVNGWQPQPETDMSIPGGAGVIVSTPADLTKFINALFAEKLINHASLLKMKTMIDGYGMGMIQVPYGKRKAFGHNGRIDSFYSDLFYFPNDSVTVAICLNGQEYKINDVLLGILNIYYGMPYDIPAFTTITLAADELDKYLGVYSSKQLPLTITVSKEGGTLIAQASGQSSFPLEATDKDKFEFEKAGVVIEFNPEKKELVLKQGGGEYLFTKDK